MNIWNDPPLGDLLVILTFVFDEGATRSLAAIYNAESLKDENRRSLFFSWGSRLERWYEHLPITVC